MNQLLKYFLNNKGLMINKWVHYFDHYHNHLNKFIGKDIILVEVGVGHGGSLQMWKNYFGPSSKIIGVDNNPKTKVLEKLGFHIEIGDQSSVDFWTSFLKKYPEIDIFIDDGAHLNFMQIITFISIFPSLKHGGVYICEDLGFGMHLSTGLKGGIQLQDTFMHFLKSLMNNMQANNWLITLNVTALIQNNQRTEYIEQNLLIQNFEALSLNEPYVQFDKDALLLYFNGGISDSDCNYYTKVLRSIHVYDQLAIVEKKDENEIERFESWKKDGNLDCYTNSSFSMTTGEISLMDFIDAQEQKSEL